MKELLRKIGSFLHILDEDDRLNLSDIAFMIIMAKIIASPTLDFPSVVTLAITILNKMQKRHVENMDDSEQVKDMTKQISDLKDKVTSIIGSVK